MFTPASHPRKRTPCFAAFFCIVLALVLPPPAAAAPGDISTAAGDGTAGFGGDGAAATAARMWLPHGVAFDASGNLFIADLFNHRIRRVDAVSGFISTVAGDGTAGFGGDGAAATAAQLNSPRSVAVDASGNLFIADANNNRIRRVNPTTGFISTVAGDGTAAFGGDGAAATAAKLDFPYGVAVDASGNLFIADFNNSRIRRIDAASKFISTVAGDGTFGFGGDGAAATAAQLGGPASVAFDVSGNLFIADGGNRIRRIDAASGFISTVAGDGTFGFGGDGAAATAAQLNNPLGVAVDASGNLFIADANNNRIRRVDAASGFISTVAGDGTAAFSGDGAAATSAQLNSPRSVAVDTSGNLFIADASNNRIRRVEAPAKPTPPKPRKPALKDTWTAWYNLASYYYAFYAAYGDYNNASAFFSYYYGVGDYYYHLARKNQGPADFALYNGLALFYLYAYSSTSSYYYYLALAYYYYFAGFGDFTNAVNYYYAYLAFAG